MPLVTSILRSGGCLARRWPQKRCFDLIETQNPLVESPDEDYPFYFPEDNPLNGVFHVDLNQTFVLQIDFKQSGPALRRQFDSQLTPFREKGYQSGPDSPASNKLDSRINTAINKPAGRTKENSSYQSFTDSIGHVWDSRLTQEQLQLIRGADQRVLKLRYWSLPEWLIGPRNHVWHILIREGVDMHDLRHATENSSTQILTLHKSNTAPDIDPEYYEVAVLVDQ
ncbi:hypothetical protein DL95DRAFT_412416 [Leptodontidium sp. 2 PMI_412]|nr:hypothetical protein DL95DRAFT_412416 [Leptodontidium sp. 2 PMI_412]